MQSSKDYFKEVLEQNRSDFERDRTSLRFMTNYVISLFHLTDWLWHSQSDQAFVLSEWGNPDITDEKEMWKYVEANVTNAGYIRDVANAVKHLKLEHKPSMPMMHHASQAISRQGSFDASFCGADFDTTEIVIDVTPPVPLARICEELYEFWKYLMDKMP